MTTYFSIFCHKLDDFHVQSYQMYHKRTAMPWFAINSLASDIV